MMLRADRALYLLLVWVVIRPLVRPFLLVACVVGAALLIAPAFGEELIEPTAEEAADIEKWIPANCCRTNNCCRKVRPVDLVPLPKNEIRVVTTGQVLARTGWSQDKNTWRCTCDYNPNTGNWDVHPNARTRCVFDHPQAY